MVFARDGHSGGSVGASAAEGPVQVLAQLQRLVSGLNPHLDLQQGALDVWRADQ